MATTPSQMFLGALLVRPEALDEVRTLVLPDDLSTPRDQKVYQAILDVADRLHDWDLHVLISDLRVRGRLEEVGGEPYFVELAGLDISPFQLTSFAETVTDESIRRSLHMIGEAIRTDLRQFGRDIAIENASSKLDHLRLRGQNDTILNASILGRGARERLLQAKRGEGHSGLATGISAIDRAAPIKPANVSVILATTNTGKSTLAATIAAHWSSLGPIMIATTETDPDSFYNKMVSAMTCINTKRIERAQFEGDEEERVLRAISQLEKRHIDIIDEGSPSGHLLKALYSIGHRRHGYVALIVDSFSKMGATANMPIYDRSVINSAALNDVARLTKSVVLCTAQAKPEVDQRPKMMQRVPKKEDIVGGGALGQDAAQILSVYYHHNHVDDLGPHDDYPEGVALIYVAKSRWDEKNFGMPVSFIPGAGFYNLADEHDVDLSTF